MNLREMVLQRCPHLPGAELSHPFGEDTAVFKVGGKMFALVDLSGAHGRVTLKADPHWAAALVAQHKRVTPGYYMNKRHWITVDLDHSTPDLVELVDELLTDSYALVVGNLPARLRPSRADHFEHPSPAEPS